MNEDAVRAHLQDVESSFMPEMSPLPVYKHKTADDTFNPSADVVPGSPTPQSRTAPAPAPSQTAQTEAQPSPDHNPAKATANPNDSKPMLSSPFVAQTSFDNKTQGSESGQDDTDDNASDATIEAGARGSKSVTLAATATLAANSADPSRTIQNAMSMSRSISMASMSSAVDENKMMDQQMGRLGDDGLPLPRIAEAPPTTPKPKTDHLDPPTDTVIARHVRNVQVPDNLVEEYKFKGDLATPRKISESFNLGIGRSAAGKNLTLREQSSTIERLSKENFDLKLKVMFLKDRLDRLSEEGIKQMISENVDLKTTLAITQRDAKTMRKRIKQLEKQLKEEEMQRPSTGRSDSDEDDEAANERQEELIFLRERVEEYVLQIEKLKLEVLNKDSEKRRMSEMVRTLSERAPGESLGRQEETDVWKDLLEQETSRREQADEDNRRLRDELFRLRQQEMNGGLKKNTSGQAQGSPARPTSGLSSEFDRTTLTGSASIVDELRRESEQLRHENAELRREVGAQTSMLTSRNREKERLYQEIEDLKMAQRRGNPAPSTVDSLLDRSASRAGVRERSHSRASGTQITAVEEDPDREELENTIADLRDNLNSLKLQNQEISLELEKCMQDFETAVEARKQSDGLILGLQEDMDIAMNDLVALQAERDEALGEQAEMEAEFEALRKEAQEEIDALESEADQHTAEIQRLTVELTERTENFEALQAEMRQMSEAVVRLEDDAEEKLRRIREMETELESSNKELEDLEHKLLEANEKSNRLGVQQESSAGEIAFLREEQESDKIRIGDLEAALANTQQNLRDEKERVKELDQRLASERRQREIVASKEKEEVQQFVNELNREATTAQDEARRLRKMLTSREVEATEWKERLMELENNLRVALGDLNGTRSSLLKSIANLQRQNEDTIRELDSSKATLVEKERIVKHRDSILESQALETRKLADLLEKERQAHRNTKNAYETFQNTHHHVARTASTMEARIQELEITRSGDKKKIATLEASFKEQVTERNNLLLILWTRLSGLCGTDWAMNNSLINGRALPSVESISTMLPGFSKNLLNAVKTIESMMTKFSARIKSVERDLWREYQALENNLEGRIKKLDRLEMLVRNGIANNSIPPGLASMGAVEMQNRYARLEEAYRQLKVENTTLRTATEVRARAGAGPGTAYTGGSAETAAQVAEIIGGSPSPGIPTGPRDKERSRKMPGLMRPSTSSRSSSSHSPHHHMGGSLVSGIPVPSTSHGHSHRTNSSLGMGMEMVARPETATGHSMAPGMGMADGEGDDTRLILRLKEMEKKLVMEREARNQDRKAARMRLGGLETENRELRSKMKRSDD
ncbi:Anucleate primary sterigmata protein B [Ceratocystis platani]|uniref:Anucleate primary sterigmata protein B n=1 Tax=Ceratocystis fimbriata f. sp. platani TaxID=88771 RepID=A0A0F8B1W0_CERFI|nr:Anucleate primary sterigmata protein B [Ceratocystis platani]